MTNSNILDVLILGGGVSGMSCALVLGSAQNKPLASDKKIGILTPQKASSLQNAIFNNAYGIASDTLGYALLIESIQHLSQNSPHIAQIPNEKVFKIEAESPEFLVTTNRNTYK